MPKLSLNSGPRLYTGDSGLKVPSVSTVLGILDNREWASAFILKNGRRNLDRLQYDAAGLGTRIHALADQLAWDRGVAVDPEMELYAEALREFFDLHVRRVIATELSLVSEKERVGGTCDLVCELHSGQIAVVDFKSKKNGGITARDRAQTAGYALLLGEHGYKVTQRVIVRIHTSEEKRGKWYCKNAEDHWGDVRAFRSAVELWWWRSGKKIAKKTATINADQ